jgi:hypothetical protein
MSAEHQGPEQQQQQQLDQQQQDEGGGKKLSWVSALQHPREFFLRFSQVRSSTAAMDEQLIMQQPWQQQQQPLPQGPSTHDPQQHPQQQRQHWWQKRASQMPQLIDEAVSTSGEGPTAAAAAAEQQPPGQAGSSSTASRGWPARRLQLLRLLDSPAASWLLIAMSLFVIFQEDFKYAVLPPTADLWFESITAALLVTFMVEIGEGGEQRGAPLAAHAAWVGPAPYAG